MYYKDYYACKHVLSKKFKMFCNFMMNYLKANTAITVTGTQESKVISDITFPFSNKNVCHCGSYLRQNDFFLNVIVL